MNQKLTPQEKYEKKLSQFFKKMIEKNDKNWKKEWLSVSVNQMNGNTQREYSGLNDVILQLSGFKDPRWFTFNQIKELGGSVKRGEEATPIEFYTHSVELNQKDENGKLILGEDNKPQKESFNLDRPIRKYYYVFNVEQTQGLNLPEFIPPEVSKEDLLKRDLININRIESVINKMDFSIQNSFNNNAYYSIFEDKIYMPDKSQFPNEKSYYGTLLHEVTHATGSKNRLNRVFPTNHSEYAKEELVAEISSFLLSKKFGLNIGNESSNNRENSIAYISDWFKNGHVTETDLIKSIRDSVRVVNYFTFAEKELSKNKESVNLILGKPDNLMKDSYQNTKQKIIMDRIEKKSINNVNEREMG